MASSPRIFTQLGARQTLELRRKARLPVHRPSACSGVKALRNTSDASRQAAKLCYRFGPLTPSARSANLTAGDGTKNGPSRSEQKTVSTTQNNRLTEKAPYKSGANLPLREFAFLRREAAVFRGCAGGASGAVGRDTPSQYAYT